jgi:hypothetical protein
MKMTSFNKIFGNIVVILLLLERLNISSVLSQTKEMELMNQNEVAKFGVEYILQHDFAPVKDFMKLSKGDTLKIKTKWMKEDFLDLYVICYSERKRMAVLYDLGNEPGNQNSFHVGNYGYGKMNSKGSWTLMDTTDSLGNEFGSNGGLWTHEQILKVIRLAKKQQQSLYFAYCDDTIAVNLKNKEPIHLGYDAEEGKEIVRELLRAQHLTLRELDSKNQEITWETGSAGKVLLKFYGFERPQQQDDITSLLKAMKPRYKAHSIALEFFKTSTLINWRSGVRRSEDLLTRRLVID